MTTRNINDLAQPLGEFISAKLGTSAEVTSVRRLPEGHSRQMLVMEVRSQSDTHHYVVRIEQNGIFGTSSAEEFKIMDALGKSGFPVAKVRWLESDPTILGQPFFIMDYVNGDASNPTGDTLEDFVKVLDGLHKLDWVAAGLDFNLKPASVEEATHLQIDRWADVYREASDSTIPLLEEGAAWLHHYAANEGRLGVVHGDPGPGNFIHDSGKVLALTDFEFCHLGHPDEDWLFCAVMRGPRSLATEDWVELYRQAANVEISPKAWRYWHVFNLFKGACANTTALKVFCKGEDPAPNLAIVGTAVHQNFLKQMSEMIMN